MPDFIFEQAEARYVNMRRLWQRSFDEVNSTISFLSKTKSRTTIFDKASKHGMNEPLPMMTSPTEKRKTQALQG